MYWVSVVVVSLNPVPVFASNSKTITSTLSNKYNYFVWQPVRAHWSGNQNVRSKICAACINQSAIHCG